MTEHKYPATIVVLHGDETGEELLDQAIQVLQPQKLGLDLNFLHFDLSLENRRATGNAVVREAAQAMKRTGLGLKAATITPEKSNDVGSPNAILRDEIDGEVILRVGRRLPRVQSVAGVHSPIAIVRMAVDDAYGSKEWRETTPEGDEVAYRTSHIRRSTCRTVAEFSFRLAKKMKACVFGGPKFTVSPTYEGMFKEELDAAAARFPDVKYEPMLIDTTFAMLLKTGGEGLVIPALNRDGDLLSDLVLQMFGSIAGSESLVMAIDESTFDVDVVMAEAPHGTAPTLKGKNIANPIAMILAGAALLSYMQNPQAERASRAIYEAVFEAVYAGIATTDLGGHMTTTEFTEEVIRRVEAKLDIWGSLGK
ncbi:MAG: isocitrate dehydrogenase [Chloroflexota bacterium]|nr:MAG: isocitrate dehydrogenase [Chloroflexota bacterium]